MDLSDIRREYIHGGLRRKDLQANPIDQFNLWLQQAIDANLSDPTAMTVATVDEHGQPFQRIVLLKMSMMPVLCLHNLAAAKRSILRTITKLASISLGIR